MVLKLTVQRIFVAEKSTKGGKSKATQKDKPKQLSIPKVFLHTFLCYPDRKHHLNRNKHFIMQGTGKQYTSVKRVGEGVEPS